MTVRVSVAVGGVHALLRWPKLVVPARSSQVANGVENSPAPVTTASLSGTGRTLMTPTQSALPPQAPRAFNDTSTTAFPTERCYP